MVAHSGAAGGPARIRSLNRPRPLRVETGDDGRPTAVCLPAGRQSVSGRRCAVEAVLEAWRIDDEWWRERPISRVYCSLLLEDGQSLVAYRDLVNRRWFKQAYRLSAGA